MAELMFLCQDGEGDQINKWVIIKKIYNFGFKTKLNERYKAVWHSFPYLKRIFSSRSAGGSSVMSVTSSCIHSSLERKSRSLRFCALHSCRTSSSSINSLRVTSSRSSSWSIWEVLFRSNFQNMMPVAVAGSTDLKTGWVECVKNRQKGKARQ